MDRLNMRTIDASVGNVAKIAELWPHCVTERLGKDGKPELAIDFDKLREELSNEALDEREERYQFTWPEKRAHSRLANTSSDMALRPCREESVGRDGTPGGFDSENLYIEGDNLEVMKLLREDYLGKVKMIYIDPPYNTGNDFVYNDDFAISKAEYEKISGVYDDGNLVIDPIQRNTESNGRFHTDWLNMIYPRLKVARDLLADDGVIFISIDSHEVVNLKKICDEIFGEKNFIEIFNWAKTETPENLSKKAKQIIENVLCYQKNRDSIKFSGIKKTSVSSNGLLNQTNSSKTLVFPANAVLTSITNQIIPAGHYRAKAYDVELLEETEVKDGFFIRPIKLHAKFKWSQEKLENEMHNGTIIRIPTLKFSPSYEKSEYDAEVPSNLINNKVGVETNEAAGNYQVELFGKKVFNYPKPVSLVKYLLGFRDCSQDDEIIIMDFFSGSATTAEAVMMLNQNNDNHLSFKYILVQLPEDLYKSLVETKTPSEKEITQNAIDFCIEHEMPCLITSLAKERIRRAGRKVKEEAGLQGQDLDIGFRVLKLDSSNMANVFYTPDEFDAKNLFTMVDNVKEGRTGEDLLFQVMPELNIPLSAKIETTEINGKKVFIVNNGDLIATFDTDVNIETVKALAEMKPQYFVMRDASASGDNVLDDFEQIFRHYSPDTVRKIL